MKKILVAALAAVAVLATSCSKENNEAAGNGEKATLNIGVTAPETRATGTPSTDASVVNFKAFVVDGDGTLKSGYSSDGSALTAANAITVTTQARKIYVIANAGDIAMADETAIQSYLADLNGTGAQGTVRWATGEVALSSSDFTQSGSDWVASKNITLKFIAARITLSIETSGDMATHYDATATDGSLVLKKVTVLNSRGESKLFGTSLIPAAYTGAKKFYEGMANPVTPFAYYPAAGDFTVAATLLSDNIAADDFATKYFYYVFENDAATAADFPTIVMIEGEYDGQAVYFPVHLASYEQWATGSASTPTFIDRGNSYDIKITLTGDPRKTTGGTYPGGTGGTDDPTKPVVTAKVSVSISLTPWVPVVLNKEF